MKSRFRIAMVASALSLLTPPAFAQKTPVATPIDAPVISNIWIKATIPGSNVSAAYLRVKSAQAVRLVKAETPVAGIAELHSMNMKDGVMEMKAESAFTVQAGKTIELKPGGMHIMLMQVAQPINVGDKVPLTLTFEGADKKPLVLKVEALALAPSGHSSH